MSDIKPTFSGEMQLAGWSQTHTSGNKVTFWLPDDDAMESFKLLTARKGNRAGQRFAVVMVEIGDDEMPIDHTEDVIDMVEIPTTRGVGLKMKVSSGGVWEPGADYHGQESPGLSDGTTAVPPDDADLPVANDQLAESSKTIVETPMEIAQRGLITIAGMLSSDRKFWEYVGTMHPVTPSNAGEAANYIRRECGITSRNELPNDMRAASHFRGIMKAFDEWRKK